MACDLDRKMAVVSDDAVRRQRAHIAKCANELCGLPKRLGLVSERASADRTTHREYANPTWERPSVRRRAERKASTIQERAYRHFP